jgi:fatty acid desaturase
MNRRTHDRSERQHERERNPYYLALSRNAPRDARRHARRVVSALGAGYVVLAVTAWFALPRFSWLGVALLWVGVLIVGALVVWLVKRGEPRR